MNIRILKVIYVLLLILNISKSQDDDLIVTDVNE